MARDRACRPEAESQRLFVAVEIPPAAKQRVADAVVPWRTRLPKARWVPPEDRHVTMRFLGPTDPHVLPWVSERVEEAATATAPVRVRVQGLGWFPSPGRARVLWAGLDDPQEGLPALARRLDDALAREFAAERRAFSAHLTIARCDPPVSLPEDFSSTPLETAWFEVERLVLFRSHLRGPSSRYEPLATFPLRG